MHLMFTPWVFGRYVDVLHFSQLTDIGIVLPPSDIFTRTIDLSPHVTC